MQNIWKYISNLGITEKSTQANQRSYILSNQINCVVLFIMVVLLIITFVTLHLMHDYMSYGTLRVLVLLILSLLNLVAARFGWNQLSKLSLIFLPPVVFLIGPTLIGYVEEESYTYYPYVFNCKFNNSAVIVESRKGKISFLDFNCLLSDAVNIH
jgi:cytochrome c oxidase subunit IV